MNKDILSVEQFAELFAAYRYHVHPMILQWVPEEKILELNRLADIHRNPQANWAILKAKGETKVSYEVWMKNIAMEFGELMFIIYRNYEISYRKNRV